VVPTSDEVAYMAIGTLGVNAGLFVDELLNEFAICENDGGSGAELERKDAAILLSPLCEPVLSVR